MNHLRKYYNKKDLPYIAITAVLGTLNHFLYRLSGYSAFTALFCPINESVWEHTKLLFFPFFFLSVWRYAHRRKSFSAYFYSRFLAVLCGMGFIIAAFYTYTGILGMHFLVADILIFFGSILISHVYASYFYVLLLTSKHTARHIALPSSGNVCILWIAAILLFFIFTCYPPNLPLFYPIF